MVQLGVQTKKEEGPVSASDVQPQMAIPMEHLEKKEMREFRPNRVISVLLAFLIGFTCYYKWKIFVSTVSYHQHLALFWYTYISMFAFLCLPCVMPTRDEHLRWRNFGKVGAVVICLFETATACAIMGWSSSPTMASAVGFNALLTVVVAYLSSHHRILGYFPFAKNAKYSKTRVTHRTNVNDIYIADSRPFEILLENRGNHVFTAHGFIVRRVVLLKQRKSVVEFTLPEVSIIPGQTLKLVPDTDCVEANALVIPGYRCFGVNVADNITTTLKANKKDDISEMEECFLHMDMWENNRGFNKITHVIETKNGPQTLEVI